MKLIDADKQKEWIKKELSDIPVHFTTSFDRGRHAALMALLNSTESGTFSPTPPVQPDTEELSQEDIKELSDMFKNIESSCNSIAGNLNGMNKTLDRFGEVITDDSST